MTDDDHLTDSPARPDGSDACGGPPAPHAQGAVGSRRLGTGLLLLGALAAAASALMHLHLWLDGYRSIPKIGPLFMANVVIGFVVALASVLWRRWPVAVAGTAFLAGTAAGLLYSAVYGLFGFQESLGAPYAGASLVVELAGACAFAGAAWCLRPGRTAPAARLRPARSASSAPRGA